MKPIKIDRRLTGSSFIDEPLQQVCVSGLLVSQLSIKIVKAIPVVAFISCKSELYNASLWV